MTVEDTRAAGSRNRAADNLEAGARIVVAAGNLAAAARTVAVVVAGRIVAVAAARLVELVEELPLVAAVAAAQLVPVPAQERQQVPARELNPLLRPLTR